MGIHFKQLGLEAEWESLASVGLIYGAEQNQNCKVAIYQIPANCFMKKRRSL